MTGTTERLTEAELDALAALADRAAMLERQADGIELENADQALMDALPIEKLGVLIAQARQSSAPDDGWLPIVLCPTDGAWRWVRLSDGGEVVAAFEGDGLGPMARRWRTKAFAYRNPSRPSGQSRGGVEVMTAPFDTFVIEDLPTGVLPTHFRPNDTVYGLPAPPSSQDKELG